MPHKPWFQQRNVCHCREWSKPSSPRAPAVLYVQFPRQARLASKLPINRTGMGIACHAATVTS
jgi:hypothetical protein